MKILALGPEGTNGHEAAKIASSALHPAKDQDVTELAAWTTVANVLLNLDETLMKP